MKQTYRHAVRLLMLLAVVLVAMPARAVLKEDSLSNSLSVLRNELITYHNEQDQMLRNSKQMSESVFESLRDIMMRSGQNSLMLYSQKSDYVFDLTYACSEAVKQYQEFRSKTIPFKTYIEKSNAEIARYDSLIDALSRMPAMMLNDRGKIDRTVCLTLASNIRSMLVENNDAMMEYVSFYNMTEQRLKNLNDYAQKRYLDIQTNIFQNGGENYLTILSQFNWHLVQSRMSFVEKYTPQHTVKSQWDARWIMYLFIAIVIYGFISISLNILTIRLLLTRLIGARFKSLRRTFLQKRTCLVLAGSVITFGIITAVLRTDWLVDSNFVQMAAGLLLEFSWLLGAILISLLLRVDGRSINSAFRVYAPLIAVAFMVFAFRIVLIPSELVNIAFPVILLVSALWQADVLRRHNKRVPKYDMYLSYISMISFVVSTCMSWLGYTLMAVQLLIWWVMMLTCILTLACVHDWMKQYAHHHGIERQVVTKAWFFRLLYHVVLPSLFVCSFVAAVYWAAGVFNLSDMTWQLFSRDFIDTEGFKMSLMSLSKVAMLWFLFRYINHTVKDLVRLVLQKRDPSTAASRSLMFINVLQVVIWSVWFISSLNILYVSNSWLLYISTGLSTGIGFAMKDILENIYYGVSLMAGRIKLGDYIICDNVRGKVTDISYVSTTLEGIDGSVITFQNSQLFSKTYKNMTKNHGYELLISEIGVAYGSNLQEVRRLLVENVKALPCVYKDKAVSVLVKSFDDSAITLKVCCWVNVLTVSADSATVMECIYDTLNENHIEIPFPQQEITIKESPTPNPSPVGRGVVSY